MLHLLTVKRLIAALLFLALLAPAAAEEAGRFFSELPDLPLMPGLEELAESGVSFDKPEGRIVEAYAQGSLTEEQVLVFYQDTLPQLGWELAGPRSFRREGEILKLEMESEAGLVTLHCSLRPE